MRTREYIGILVREEAALRVADRRLTVKEADQWSACAQWIAQELDLGDFRPSED